jgi:Ca2+-binding RTX toxin-like protein
MAIVGPGSPQPVDMAAFDIDDFSDGDVTVHTDTTYRIERGDGAEELTGSFTYDANGQLIGGTITGWQHVIGGEVAFSIGGFSTPVSDLLGFIDDHDSRGFLAAILAGDDIVNGYIFNDSLLAFAGNDILDGSLGADRMSGGTGDDQYYVDNARDRVIEARGEGEDTVLSAANDYVLDANVEFLFLQEGAVNGTGNAQDNNIIGNDQNNILNGRGGDDFLNGVEGNDTLIGGAGNDAFNDQFGADSMIGGFGNDSYSVDDPNDVVVEAAQQGIDTVGSLVDYVLPDNVENLNLLFTAYNAIGNELDNIIQADGQHDNLLDGAGGDDSLSGWVGNDTLIGGTGNDTLDGGPGDDSMVGGEGNDTYLVDSVGDVTVELPGGGIDSVVSAIDHVLQAEVENLTLVGAATVGFGNELGNFITANETSSYLRGLAGNDTLNGAAGNDTVIGDEGDDRLNGAAGDDSLTGDDGNDRLAGGDGNDTLDGGSGVDRMAGGAGDDLYYLDNPGDKVIEHAGQGTDTITSSFDYVLGANLENLTLAGSATYGTGNGLDNVIAGNDADNVLSGRGGDDYLIGLGGGDTLLGGAGDDTLTNAPDGGDILIGGAGDDGYINWGGATVVEAANQGTDSVLSLVDYLLPDNVENLDLFHTAHSGTGNELDNVISGSGQAGQELDGAGGNDYLSDSAGNDRLFGGDGNDTLSASYGVDTLTGGTGSDHFVQSGDLSAGPDTIADFTLGAGGDVLDIADLLTGFGAGTSDPNDFVQCETLGGNTTVSVDADGAAGGAAFTDVCVLSGVSTTTNQLVEGGNLELASATA